MIPPRTLLRVWKSLHPSSSGWGSESVSTILFPSDGELAGQALISSHAKVTGYEHVGLRLIIPLDPEGSVRSDTLYTVDHSSARTMADSVRTVSDKTMKLTWVKDESGGDRYNTSNGAVSLKFATDGVMPFPIDHADQELRSLDADFQWFLPMWNWTSKPGKGYPNVVFSSGAVKATDGHKLAMVHSDLPVEDSYAISGKHLELAKSLGKMEGSTVQWTRFRTHLLIRGENWHLAIPVLTGKAAEFPPTDALMEPLRSPAWSGAIRSVDVVKFLKAARKTAAEMVGKHSDPLLILVPTDAGLSLQYTVSTDSEQVIIPTPDGVFGARDSGTGGVAAVGVNPGYFTAALEMVNSPLPVLTFATSSGGSSPSTPILLESEDPKSQALVMPVRLEKEPISLSALLKKRGAAGKVA
jgi:hypothetical protein